MSLLDFLKKKTSFTKSKEGKKKIEKKAVEEKKNTKKAVKSPVKASSVISYNIIKEPHISEKETMLQDDNQYVFKIYPNVNKAEIKKEVEGIYGVNVLSVNIVKSPKKKRRLGKVQGFKSGNTRAIVKIKEGQKIEIL
ncbi:MAG: 50S ribosomal protein L23 [Candidatus Staskawiczbacteria bacterium]|nr:50S ribosomal protein L23 [Candidatus Staskawiczbacteria bacterium]